MIETLSWIAIKSFLYKVFAWCKKYWQFILGLSVGLVIFLLTRDRRKILKTFEKFKKASDQMIDSAIEIEKNQDKRTSDAIESYKEKLESASEENIKRDELISSEKEKIKDSLLEREKSSPGTIAEEINKELEDIN